MDHTRQTNRQVTQDRQTADGSHKTDKQTGYTG